MSNVVEAKLAAVGLVPATPLALTVKKPAGTPPGIVPKAAGLVLKLGPAISITGPPLKDAPMSITIALPAEAQRADATTPAANPNRSFVITWLRFSPRYRASYLAARDRSEERRVGKECRSRWSPY